MNKLIFFICFSVIANAVIAQSKNKYVNVFFQTIVNGKQLVLTDSNYYNVFKEHYTIGKLKYYVSDIKLVNDKNTISQKSIFLINASKNNIVKVPYSNSNIKGISFLLGVDSLNNCSGAQSGALDPLNDMFWTWNNGYVMFKLEGKSDSSKADNNRIEHHIGGYKGANKTMRKIFLPIDENYFKKNNSITIQLNLDKYWKSLNELLISETPVITAPGEKAKMAADNFEGMFLIKN